MELSREDADEVRAAAAACEQLITRALARGSRELVLLQADVRALQACPVDETFAKALTQLDDSFPYRQDRGATWISRGDKKFLARLKRAGASYGDTPDSTVDGIVAALDRVRYLYGTAVRLATHARAWKDR